MILIGPVTYIVTISKEDCVKIKLWEQLFVTIYIFCRLLFCHWPTYIRGHEVSWTSWGHLLLCCCSVARRKQGNSRIVSDVEFGIWFKTLMEFEKLSYFKYYTIGVGKLAWVNTSLIDLKYWGRIRWGLNTAKFETSSALEGSRIQFNSSMSERKAEDVFTQICVLLERYPETIPLTNAWIMAKTVQSPKARKRAGSKSSGSNKAELFSNISKYFRLNYLYTHHICDMMYL